MPCATGSLHPPRYGVNTGAYLPKANDVLNVLLGEECGACAKIRRGLCLQQARVLIRVVLWHRGRTTYNLIAKNMA
jgi:hypothetical protein